MNSQSIFWKLSAGLLTIGIAVGLMVFSAPPSFLLNNYNSDMGIVVLMSNSDIFGIESLYYWGQDRLSGVAYGLMAFFHRLLGVHWQPQGMLRVASMWLALTLPLMALWTRSLGIGLVACALITASPLREVLFDVSQPYGWQWIWLLAAFLALTRLTESLQGSERMSVRWWWCLLFALTTWQAQWANALSGLTLLGCVLLEILSDRSALRLKTLWLGLPWVVAVSVEALTKLVAHQHARRLFGASVSTHMSLALDSSPRALQTAIGHFSGVTLKACLVFCVAISIVSALTALRGRTLNSRFTRPIAYMAMMVAANILILPLIRHIQENDVNGRYFVLAVTFAPLPVLIAFFDFLQGLSQTKAWGAPTAQGLSMVIALATSFSRPLNATSEALQRHSKVAARLSEASPTAFIASGYWDTYAVSGVAPPHSLRGIARPGQYHRTRHWNAALDDAGLVWVGTQGFDSPPERDRFNGFFKHLMVGRTLFEVKPEVEPLIVEGSEYRLYVKQASSLSGERRLKVCKDSPLGVEALSSQSLWLFSELMGDNDFGVFRGDLSVEPRVKEGYLTCWSSDFLQGNHSLQFVSKETQTNCAYVYLFGTSAPCITDMP